MKLKFDANQPYQHDAINAIAAIFEGQPKGASNFEYGLNESGSLNLIAGVANKILLTENQILKNVQTIQKNNDIPVTNRLDGMNFSIEMETGTGKTYVYLRTIYELNQTYGFKKFVIVVPSVAIREGVLKNLHITQDHFQTLYEKIPVNFNVYDSSRVSQLRSFATGNTIEILILNIDSFAKDENIINKANDRLTGQRPIEFIQATNPIVIIDEPQNMETEKRSDALKNLNPLCTLRYSATHKNTYNLLYSLNPVKAYDLGLVKQIEVDSILAKNSKNSAFITLDQITATKTRITAKLTIDTNGKNEVQRKTLTVNQGNDLYTLSQEREIYKDGYIIEEIDASNQCLTFSNGTSLIVGQNQGGLTDEIMKYQIRKTVEEHLKKERILHSKGIKVLSLFFIDKVSNYRQYDDAGNATKGKFATWFEEIYCELSQTNSATGTHNGYFSKDKKGTIKDTNGGTLADDDTYKLIMQDKERLLSLETPLRFIFSHSALREGWDNPNVFQICTLNESKSEMKKRQEIGRGLRLAVNQDGERIFDKSINRLTVIANESYDDFAKALQKEIEDDCGVSFAGRIKNKENNPSIKYRKGFELDENFKDIWERIKYKTTYRVTYDTQELIKQASHAVHTLPTIHAPEIRSEKTKLNMTSKGIEGDLISTPKGIKLDTTQLLIPDILGFIQSKVELTRGTIFEILKQSGRLNDVMINPQLFLDLSANVIQHTLHNLMIKGISYTKMGTTDYEMRLFDDENLTVDLDTHFHEVKNQHKTIYATHIPLDSSVESSFAKDCETNEQVQFYFKLPTWFKIPTPIGNYNPDWALIFKDEKKIYFVAETKSTLDHHKLRHEEAQKIHCGQKHFEIGDNVEYRHVTKLSDIIG